jgi:hypothetical protein
MIIYDQTAIAFLQKCQVLVKQILGELKIQTRQSRFVLKGYLYPIQVVVFEGRELAHFDASYLQIALNRKLITGAKESVLRDILKHEIAHYLTFILHGEVASHGQEFHQVCRDYGLSPEIAQATMQLEAANQEKVGDLEAEKVLEKVKKLLQLARSNNAHEAELATIKANSLLLRHNLDHVQSDEEPIYLDRLLRRGRKDTKLSAIQSILKHFIVKAVMSSGRNTCCLEVSGTLTNVKLARYVAEFLDREMDDMWEEAQRDHGLKGLRAKNSFFAGIAKGFDLKMSKAKQDFTTDEQKALVLVERSLDEKTKIIYRRLSSYSSGASYHEEAGHLGMEKGKNLTIREGVESKSKGLYLPR